MQADAVEVHLDDEALGLVEVGRLLPSFTGPRVLASSSFQYSEDYLSLSGAFAISPDLPLTSGRIWAPESHVLFGAFEDASPDEWGQHLIAANHAERRKRDSRIPPLRGSWDHLLGVSDVSRIGALRFRRGDGDWLSSDDGVANIHELDRIVRIAARYEDDDATDDEIAYLSGIATSPGGARPKANVRREDGRLALAKLPHSKDGDLDVERWEAVALTLAARSGLSTPEWTLVRASPGTSVLVVDRFDRIAAGGRRAYLSAASALGIGANDPSRYTYEQFSDVLNDLSADPRSDLHEMFGRIALSVLINNVDDHWRNHGFVRQADGWRLAPLFDVNPSTSIGVVTSRPINELDDPRNRSLENLLDIADAYRLTRTAGAAIIRRVATAVAAWREAAAELDLARSEVGRMDRAFDSTRIGEGAVLQ